MESLTNIEPQVPPVGSAVKIITGLFFAAAGVLLSLDNLGLVRAGHYLRYWPVVLIAIGIVKLTDDATRGAGTVITAIGTVLLAVTARWIRFSVFELWPLLLVGAGVAVVSHSLGFGPQPAAAAAGRGSTIWAILASPRLVRDVREFSRSRIVAFMGGCELDLTGDPADTTPVSIEIVAIWGGAVVRVPEGWDVVGEALPIMGGVDVKSRPRTGSRRVVIRGLALMGGIEVKHIPAEAS